MGNCYNCVYFDCPFLEKLLFGIFLKIIKSFLVSLRWKFRNMSAIFLKSQNELNFQPLAADFFYYSSPKANDDVGVFFSSSIVLLKQTLCHHEKGLYLILLKLKSS